MCPIRGTNLTYAMNHEGGKSVRVIVSVVSLTFADKARFIDLFQLKIKER